MLLKVETLPAERAIQYLPGLDAARIIASFAVVYLHAVLHPDRPEPAWTRFAVPFFTISAAYLTTSITLRKSDRTLGEFAKGRFIRLLCPFYFWCAFYLLMRVIKRMFEPGPPLTLSPGMLLEGTAVHLWFLPFLFFVSFIAFFAAKTAIIRPAIRNPLAVGFAILAVACWLPRIDLVQLTSRIPILNDAPYFVSWSYDRSFPAFIGIAIGLATDRVKRAIFSQKLTLLYGLCFLAAIASLYFLGRDQFRIRGGVAGLTLALFCMSLPVVPSPAKFLVTLAPLSYGVYLSHIFFYEIMRVVRFKLNISSAYHYDAVGAMFIFALSLGLSALLWRSRSTRWMLGG